MLFTVPNCADTVSDSDMDDARESDKACMGDAREPDKACMDDAREPDKACMDDAREPYKAVLVGGQKRKKL